MSSGRRKKMFKKKNFCSKQNFKLSQKEEENKDPRTSTLFTVGEPHLQ